MARINIYEDGELAGWFNPSQCERFTAESEWDGDKHVSVITNDYAAEEVLYRTPGGRWVTEYTSRWVGVSDRYEFLTDEQAEDWLLRSRKNDDAVERFFGELAEESGPIGRPPLDGKDIKIKVPHDLLDAIDSAADDAGVSRSEWIRDACAAKL